MGLLTSEFSEAVDLRSLAETLERSGPSALVVDGETVPLSPAASAMVREAITALAKTGSAEVASRDRFVTREHAATLLGLSVDDVQQLVDQGSLTLVNDHIPFADITKFQQQRHAALIDHARLIEEYPDPPFTIDELLEDIQRVRDEARPTT